MTINTIYPEMAVMLEKGEDAEKMSKRKPMRMRCVLGSECEW